MSIIDYFLNFFEKLFNFISEEQAMFISSITLAILYFFLLWSDYTDYLFLSLIILCIPVLFFNSLYEFFQWLSVFIFRNTNPIDENVSEEFSKILMNSYYNNDYNNYPYKKPISAIFYKKNSEYLLTITSNDFTLDWSHNLVSPQITIASHLKKHPLFEEAKRDYIILNKRKLYIKNISIISHDSRNKANTIARNKQLNLFVKLYFIHWLIILLFFLIGLYSNYNTNNPLLNRTKNEFSKFDNYLQILSDIILTTHPFQNHNSMVVGFFNVTMFKSYQLGKNFKILGLNKNTKKAYLYFIGIAEEDRIIKEYSHLKTLNDWRNNTDLKNIKNENHIINIINELEKAKLIKYDFHNRNLYIL